MLLTRKACYGLIVVKRLAESAPEATLSANDLAGLYGFPQEALAKILQQLARAGLLLSHHGINGGYSLARDPHQITVLDVIKACHGITRPHIRGKHWRRLEALPGYDQLLMVNQVVEDALRRVTIADMNSMAESGLPGGGGGPKRRGRSLGHISHVRSPSARQCRDSRTGVLGTRRTRGCRL